MVNHESSTHKTITKGKEILEKTCEENLKEKEVSSSSLPPPVAVEADVTPIRSYDPMQNQRLYDFYLVDLPKKIDAFIKSTPQILNDKEPVQYNYQGLYDYYDSIQQKLHDFIMKNNLNSNLNMISDADDLGMNSDTNVGPNEKQSFMDMSKEQTDDIGEHVDIPSMDGSHHQPSTASLVSPITVGDDCAPNITNNL
ncbi:MADS-box transcription factor PHERES 1 [Eutrema salsugineum]|uniref:MADS-box transcription factor PHERES 1 n=1 Tax=Eutrema salsugineum TaxID=72664 RepID=UPI000CED34DE|nr:MADS-box transcription factor PHERES 1 [Eutrema salsugineum]